MKIKIPEYLELDSRNYLYSVVTTENGEILKLDDKSTIYIKEISCNYLILKEEDAGNKATIICDDNAIVVDRDIIPSTYLPSLGREDKPFNTSYFNGLKIPIYGMNDDLDAGIFFSLDTSYGGDNVSGFSTASLEADKIGKIYFNSTYGDFDHIGDGDQSISFVVMDSSQNDHYPLVLTTDEVTICDHIIIKESNSRLNLIYKPTTTEYTILSGNESSASLSTNTEIILSTNPALVDMTQDSQGGGQILFSFQAYNETSRNSSFYLNRHAFYPTNDSNQNSSLGTNNNRWKEGWFTDITGTNITGTNIIGTNALINTINFSEMGDYHKFFFDYKNSSSQSSSQSNTEFEPPIGSCVEAIFAVYGKFSLNKTTTSTSYILEPINTTVEIYLKRALYMARNYENAQLLRDKVPGNTFEEIYESANPRFRPNPEDSVTSLLNACELNEPYSLLYLNNTEGRVRFSTFTQGLSTLGRYRIFLINRIIPVNSGGSIQPCWVRIENVNQCSPYADQYTAYYLNATDAQGPQLLMQKYRCLVLRIA
jgi:hypothetical protein